MFKISNNKPHNNFHDIVTKMICFFHFYHSILNLSLSGGRKHPYLFYHNIYRCVAWFEIGERHNGIFYRRFRFLIHPSPTECRWVFIFLCFMLQEDPIMVLLCLGIFRVRAFSHFSHNRNYLIPVFWTFIFSIC